MGQVLPMGLDQPACYEIKVVGELGDQWAAWFPGMRIVAEQKNGASVTKLIGEVIDQADLYGLISRIRDMGLSLISINRL